jgi:hypothetical protein
MCFYFYCTKNTSWTMVQPMLRDHSLIGWPRTNNFVLGHVRVLIKQKFKPIRDTGTAVECRTTWSHSCFNKPKFIQYYYTGIFGVPPKIGVRSSSVAGAQFVAARGVTCFPFSTQSLQGTPVSCQILLLRPMY